MLRAKFTRTPDDSLSVFMFDPAIVCVETITEHDRSVYVLCQRKDFDDLDAFENIGNIGNINILTNSSNFMFHRKTSSVRMVPNL